jgi:lysophospholipase L1-like esterase
VRDAGPPAGRAEKSRQRDKQLLRSHDPHVHSVTDSIRSLAMNFLRKDIKHLCLFASLACAAICLPAQAAGPSQAWIATWGAAQQIPEPQNALAPGDLRDATVRQVFHLSVAGDTLRVKVSNAFGTTALHVTAVHVARPVAADSSAIDAASDRALSFAGAPDVIVPPGAEFLSDPIDYPVKALSNLAVTFHLDEAPAVETGHPGSRATTYVEHGNQVGAATFGAPQKVEHWYQIAEIDVRASPGAGSVVALGDSITDGHASTTNGNDRWTDVLAKRLQQSSATRAIGVVNKGIGGNHLLTDGLGPNALARFDRDVLAPAGARWLIVLEGVNDLGGMARAGHASPAEHAELVHRIIASYAQIIERAHAHGIRVIGGTITPFAGSDYYHPDAATEADRQAINSWIRAHGHFDAVADFDAVARDPKQPDRLLPAYDCGDHLHPSPAGYRAMGDAIPLSLFAR